MSNRREYLLNKVLQSVAYLQSKDDLSPNICIGGPERILQILEYFPGFSFYIDKFGNRKCKYGSDVYNWIYKNLNIEEDEGEDLLEISRGEYTASIYVNYAELAI